jgi:hypothetical protein
MERGLVSFDQSRDLVEFYSAAGGRPSLLRAQPASGRRWRDIVPGQFYDSLQAGLLFYEPLSGTGQFYMPLLSGLGFSLASPSEHHGWRTTWTHIIAGHFDTEESRMESSADLLFYDAATGYGEFYTAHETTNTGAPQVQLRFLRAYTDWRPGWTHIIPGRFGGDGRTDLLFYQASTGTGEFYTCTGRALLKPLKSHTGWRGSWRHIVPGHFGGDAFTDLLFYDSTAGVGEFYATHQGDIELLATHAGWRTTWAAIVPGDFAGGGRTSLAFYDPTDGTLEFYATQNGQIGMLAEPIQWGTTRECLARFDCEMRAGEL